MSYLEWRRRAALAAGEGYGDGLVNEPAPFAGEHWPHPLLAILPLLLVGVATNCSRCGSRRLYGETHSFDPAVIGSAAPKWCRKFQGRRDLGGAGALLVGIVVRAALAWKPVIASFAEGTKSAIGGALLASMNTASEYGFGAVIAALPGFLVVANALSRDPQSAGQRSGHRDRAGRHHRLAPRAA
jgi:H+/gluconate symporter-like permease